MILRWCIELTRQASKLFTFDIIHPKEVPAKSVFDGYNFFDVNVTWKQTRLACRFMEAHLVTMDTLAEWEIVRNAIARKVGNDTTNRQGYVGSRKVGDMWKWTEEPEGVTQGTVNESSWQYWEPIDNSQELCVEIQSSYRGQEGHLNDVVCNENPSLLIPRGFICESGL